MDLTPAFHTSFNQANIDRIFAKCRKVGFITADDEELIREYVAEAQVERGLSIIRAQANSWLLCHWRRFVPHEWRGVTLGHVHQGIAALREGKTLKGKPYKQNTIRDFVKELKPFLRWLHETDRTSIDMEKVRKIRTPQKDWHTTPASRLLTEAEVLALIEACRTSQHRAMIAVLFEGGPRIGELARLKWEDVEIAEEYVGIHIMDTKERKRRYACLLWGREYLIKWMNDYPLDPFASGAFVFLNQRRLPHTYYGVRSILDTITTRAGIERTLNPHLFRKSRITDMVRKGYQESVILESMWGNLDSAMLRTYVVLAESDIRAEHMEKAGLRKKTAEVPVLAPRQCPKCLTIHPPTARYCDQCRSPLTAEAAAKVKAAISLLWTDQEAVMELAEEMKKKNKGI